MDQALFLSAVLMGLAGTPHCLAMCGAACTAAAGGGRWRKLLPFHLGRLVAYAAAGAVAAASVGSLAAMGQAAALRPLWTLVHIAALALGLYLLWQGRQPGWMERLGRTRRPTTGLNRAGIHRAGEHLAGKHCAGEHRDGGHWQVMAGPARSAGLGLAWVAWPCGLLQSALLVAALANTPASGALVMAGFAGASAAGLLLGPALWWRLWRRLPSGRAGPGTGSAAGLSAASAAGSAAGSARPAVRWAGAALAGASVWALGHGLWLRLAAWCLG